MFEFAMGPLVGTLCGAVIMALCAAAGQADKCENVRQSDQTE